MFCSFNEKHPEQIKICLRILMNFYCIAISGEKCSIFIHFMRELFNGLFSCSISEKEKKKD